MSQIFDYIGRAITSLAAVIFAMLMIISGMTFFSHTLFSQVFPVGMQLWEKLAATWLLALGWEVTVLLTTCNTRHINKHIPAVMAICSGIIVLFFIQAFDDQQTALTLVQRWFVGILAATINYIYAELFYKKWKERNELNELPMKFNELHSKAVELTRLCDEKQIHIQRLSFKLDDRDKELNELRKFKDKIQSDLKCPHCNVIQDNFGTLHAHKGHCLKNPKNQKS